MPHSRVALYATWIHMGSHMCHEYRQRLSRLWLLSHAYMAASQPHSRPSSQPHKLTASQAHSRRASQPTILTPLHPHNLIADHPHILSPSKSHTLTISQPYRSRSFCVRSNSCGAARVIDGRSGRPCVIPCLRLKLVVPRIKFRPISPRPFDHFSHAPITPCQKSFKV